jgi:carbamate kinase
MDHPASGRRRAVVALGGNALLRRGEPPEAANQARAARDAARILARATPDGLRTRRYPAGSMGPKVEAACRCVERTGRTAANASLDDVQETLDGRAGTQVDATGPKLEPRGGRRARVA